MKRKLLAGITAAALVLGGAAILPEEIEFITDPIVAQAASDLKFSVNDDGTLTFTGYSGTDPELVIPEKYNGRTVTVLDYMCCYENKVITKVTLPDTVKKIGNFAFEECTNLESVNLPEGLESIGYKAFRSTKISEVTIPNTVTKIGGSAFVDTLVKEAVIPDSVKEYGGSVFEGCKYLESITFPDKADGTDQYGEPLWSIGSFWGCSSLKSIKIPKGITKIGAYRAFFNCTSLESVELPKGLKSISDEAFANCDSLASITVPKSVTDIKSHALGYSALKDDFVIIGFLGSEAENYALENGFEFEPVPYEPGDADGDGEVNMMDYAMMQRALAGWEIEINKDACDLNGDGEVNMLDYALFQRMLAGWDIA